ncbi:MAG: hypothetical protein AABN33_26860 [Acidobacteriota bacterium]
MPIVDWRSGQVQIRTWLRSNKRYQYLTLVKIPLGHPVRLCFTYGASNFIKQVVWSSEYRPLCEWPPKYVNALTDWWDAYRLPGERDSEPGGLMADEPRLFLGERLPDACIRWTKDVRLLYRSKSSRRRTSNVRDET